MSGIMSNNEQNYKMDMIPRKNIDDDDLFKENMSPCSKKMKLFDEIEKQFLSTGNISVNIIKHKINEIKPLISLHEESKRTTESTKNHRSVVIEKNNTDDKLALKRRVNENDKEVKTTSEIGQIEIRKENIVYNTQPKESTVHREHENETKNQIGMTKSENLSDCKDFENILDKHMQDQENETSDVESEQDEIKEQINSEQDEIKEQTSDVDSEQEEIKEQTSDVDSELEEIKEQTSDVKSEQDEKEEQLNIQEKEIDEEKENDLDMEESELDEDEKSENGEEEANEDEEEDNESEEESEKAMSFLEKRRLNKMKLAGQMSNLLVSARSKMKQIVQNLEQSKIEINPNPRKRKRSVLIDQSTRELIKEITPVRRSSRQVERKFYTEGVTDPELIKLLNKLENYVRLNGKFKPSQDESCYEEDFLGFKQDASRRALYPEDYNPKRRRYRRVVHRSGRSVPVPAMDPSEITDDVLSKVVTHVSAKVYSQTGSTCHQCRQKTLDTKTFCRSGVCTGVRGQFCGVCLLNRYGEDIVKTLLDEKWACPPCRDICNCSICRNRKGLPPTGIMTPFALGKGFDSVKDYLKEAEKDLEFEEY